MNESKPLAKLIRFARHAAASASARKVGGALVVNVLGAAIAFGLQILLARLLGVESFGQYIYALTWITLCVLLGKLGLDVTAQRFVPEYEARANWGLLRGFIRRGKQATLLAASLLAVIVALAVVLAGPRIDAQLRDVFLCAALLLPLNAYLIVQGAYLQGLRRIVAAQAPQVIVRPLLFAAALLIAALLMPLHDAAVIAMLLNVITALATIALMIFITRARIPVEVRGAPPEYQTKQWAKVALPMMGITSFTLLLNQADVIMVGALLSTTDAGIYSAASRVALLLTFAVTLVNSVTAPMISRLCTQGKTAELQRLLNVVAWGSFAFATPLCLAVMFFGEDIMRLFGPQFIPGTGALLILAAARWINALTGAAGYLMSMSGHERQAAWILGGSVVLNLLLNALLIPPYGIEGAAIATLMTTILGGALMVIYGWKYLGVNSCLSFRFSWT